MLTKKLAMGIFVAMAGLSWGTSTYAADAGDWLVRGRVINVNPNDDSGEVTGISGSGVSVDSATTAELDFTYFLDKNWALELILATTGHDINGTGSVASLGKVVDTKVLPPTLTLQYHADMSESVRAYAGVGLNYTLFYSEDGTGAFEGADVDLDSSFGLAGQLGVDIDINDDWFFNLDVKYIAIDTTAEINTGTSVLTVDADIDPWVFGIGFGTKF